MYALFRYLESRLKTQGRDYPPYERAAVSNAPDPNYIQDCLSLKDKKGIMQWTDKKLLMAECTPVLLWNAWKWKLFILDYIDSVYKTCYYLYNVLKI